MLTTQISCKYLSFTNDDYYKILYNIVSKDNKNPFQNFRRYYVHY